MRSYFRSPFGRRNGGAVHKGREHISVVPALVAAAARATERLAIVANLLTHRHWYYRAPPVVANGNVSQAMSEPLALSLDNPACPSRVAQYDL